MTKQFYVYILATGRNGTFYVGVTSDLVKRIWEHKNGERDKARKETEEMDPRVQDESDRGNESRMGGYL